MTVFTPVSLISYLTGTFCLSQLVHMSCAGYHEVPVEPLVPNKPVQNLITDESTSAMLEPRAEMINSSVTSNVTTTTADESTALMSSAIISIVSTLATLLLASLFFHLVSD